MAVPPIVSATLQTAVLSGTSNILAQAITAHRFDQPLEMDWVPFIQFVLFAILSTPPNFVWQDYLESTFPAYKATPTPEAIASAAAGNEKELDKEAREGRLVEPRLHLPNTLAKFVLDQTIGAAVNTVLFSVYIHSIQMAMPTAPAAVGDGGVGNAAAAAAAAAAIDFSGVDFGTVLSKSREDFMPIVVAGWKLWPWVSLVNFTLVKSVEMRNLVGGLAGVVWGVYMSLVAAR